LLSLGIGAGDEVIVPSFTFAATANSVALTGAKPIFVDIDLKTYNINPTQIEAAITPRTKAIQVVHLYGLPADMLTITAIAKKHNLWLIEDDCDSLGATYNGQKTGTFGDLATLSFYPAHHITMGEGGAVLINNADQNVAEQFKTVKLLQFPYYPNDFSMSAYNLTTKTGNNPKFNWSINQAVADYFIGIKISLYLYALVYTLIKKE
jgi:dTDP-4-amino-4,6-dideoxygalactose transaminase